MRRSASKRAVLDGRRRRETSRPNENGKNAIHGARPARDGPIIGSRKSKRG